jgi:hypothetical protein
MKIDKILSQGFIYRMIITIVGDEEKSLIRELKGRFNKEQLLNSKDGISLAKTKLSDLEKFLLARGKED